MTYFSRVKKLQNGGEKVISHELEVIFLKLTSGLHNKNPRWWIIWSFGEISMGKNYQNVVKNH
jgi:hypothetical protein